ALGSAPACPNTWHPVDHWWWWRASRVIHDRNLLGQDQEVIDEFPFFSFLLGDMHPHVLALPFVLVAIGLALNVLFSATGSGDSVFPMGDKLGLVFYALILGGLSFLNTWDFPIYLALLVAAYGLALYRHKGYALSRAIEEGIRIGLLLGVGGVLLYLPFYIGFRSQASGILPVLFNTTKVHQYLIMFGLFLFVGIAFLIREVLSPSACTPGGKFWFITTGALFFALVCVLLRRLLPALLIPVMLACAFKLLSREEEAEGQAPSSFALLLLLSGLLLTFVVEFIYIKDAFGIRMNTVFKFYYQAWVQMALAAAFGTYALLEGRRKLSPLPRMAFTVALGLLMAVGIYYPLAASATRIFVEAPMPHPTLDGIAYFKEARPGDYEAIRWLNENVRGAPVILEATGGSYSEYAHISACTGLPTVLGWDFHELQWRGSYDEPAKRRPDIEKIYTTPDAEEAARLLDKYGVEYVYIGPLEKRTYHLSTATIQKFAKFMKLVYDAPDVKIFQRQPRLQ
ncbi:MAG TPA: hypothetical protein ENG33_05270, partial [Chloroflexi bacterium]|nr:hypothetical protein [Chloroflexota bacterium]